MNVRRLIITILCIVEDILSILLVPKAANYIESRYRPFIYHSNYRYVEPSQVKWLSRTGNQSEEDCPVLPTFERSDWSKFRVESDERSFREASRWKPRSQSLIKIQNALQKLGFPHNSSWEPTTCSPVHNVTVVVPYRNRRDHLKRFLVHMHPFLKLQKVKYRIIVVEQVDDGTKFNRAKLFNVGYAEGQKRFPSDCYVFHDIDLLPLHLGNIYGCTEMPRHMSAMITAWRFEFSYEALCGGVISISSEQFKRINGYSNSYKGWGAEDDDLSARVHRSNLRVIRFPPDITSYMMSSHIKNAIVSNESLRLWRTWEGRWRVDGLNTLKYKLVAFQDGIGFTAIRVQFE